MSRNEEILAKFRENADLVNDRIRTGIEMNRKGYATVTVVDVEGNPLAGKRIRVKHRKHDFLFGANIFMLDEMESEEKNEAYKSAFSSCFNAATLPFYWRDLEPEEGRPRFAKDSPKVYRRPAPDLCLEFCERNNITPKAHCLTYITWEPEWLDVNDLHCVREKYEKRYRELADRYKDRIHGWEVINETLLLNNDETMEKPYFNEPRLVEENFALAERYFRGNELIINEATPQVWERHTFYNGNRSAYYMLIERALRNGARIDCIGMQYHGFVKREDEKTLLDSIYDPIQIYRVLDKYAELNLPIQITEVTVPAFSDSEEDLGTQAELVEWLYRIWFSHPAVEAAIYWNLVDGYAAFAPLGDMTAGENYYHGGLLDFSMKRKPAYETIRRLVHDEWTTDETLTSDERGRVKFKGFFGEYDIEVDGVIYKAKIAKSAKNEIRITVK